MVDPVYPCSILADLQEQTPASVATAELLVNITG